MSNPQPSDSAYKKIFWILAAAMVTWTGLGAYSLISVTKDVANISISLNKMDTAFTSRFGALQNDVKSLRQWKGFMEGKYGKPN